MHSWLKLITWLATTNRSAKSPHEQPVARSRNWGRLNKNHFPFEGIFLEQILSDWSFVRKIEWKNGFELFQKFPVELHNRNFRSLVHFYSGKSRFLGTHHFPARKVADEKSLKVRVSVNDFPSGQLAAFVDDAGDEASTDLKVPSRTNAVSSLVVRYLKFMISINVKINKLNDLFMGYINIGLL